MINQLCNSLKQSAKFDFRDGGSIIPLSKPKIENTGKNLVVLSSVFRVDPTRTLTLRNRFVSQMERRFGRIKKLIKISILDRDCFGLLPKVIPSISSLEAASQKQFDFERTEDKVKAFMDWLKVQQNTKDEYGEPVLNITEGEERQVAGNKAWTNLYIESAYKKGILRAQLEMKKINIPGADRGLEVALFSPIHADRLGLIYTRTYEHLKTVTALMDTEIQNKVSDGLTTGLAKGIAEGKSPWNIAKELVKDVNNRVDAIGIHRARMIARSEVVRAHHVAQINEYREAGMEGVQVVAELMATNDLDVCSRCKDLEAQSKNKPFTLDEIEPLIPVHPNCRCTSLPVVKLPKEKKKKPPESEPRRFESKKELEQYEQMTIEQYSKFREKKSPDVSRSLDYYKGSGYETINSYNRAIYIPKKKELLDRVKYLTKNIDKAIEEAPPLQESTIVYRGIRDYKGGHNWKMSEGKIIEDKGFMSTSFSYHTSQNFVKSLDNSAFLEITLPKGQKGVSYVGVYGNTDSEHEFILPRGTKLKITEVQEFKWREATEEGLKDYSKYNIKAEVVPE